MIAVIFRARIAAMDEEYSQMAERLRKLARDRYGCLEFHSVCEGNVEIAISYWESEEQIRAWKNDPEHLQAQQLGQARWYSSYRVEVVNVLRGFEGGGGNKPGGI